MSSTTKRKSAREKGAVPTANKRPARKPAAARKPGSVAMDGQEPKARQRRAAPGKDRSPGKTEKIVDQPPPDAASHTERRKKGGHKAEKAPWPDMSRAEAMEMPEHLREKPKRISCTPQIFDYVLHQLATGRTMRSICREPDMPAASTVMDYVMACGPADRERYTRARNHSIESLADEILDLADDATGDFVDRETRDGRTERVLNIENVHRSRLRVEARKWLIGKLKPEKYGDKTQLDVRANIQISPADTISILELARRKQFIDQRVIDVAAEQGMTPAALLAGPGEVIDAEFE